jgi:flagellar basal-body rod modification protein FlgD
MPAINTSVLDSVNGTTSSATPKTANDLASADRFLKLLVAQVQNQDPLNPMDNAQMTSQMAQINTVTGIEKLNQSVNGLSSQFMQMQALQGASLVGHDVVVPGNKLAINTETRTATGGFELTSAADNVTVEVLSASGQVVDTVQLGAAGEGLHGFVWPSGDRAADSGLKFRVTATRGGVKSDVTELVRDTVRAVSTKGNSLQLELATVGSVPYSDVRSFN